MIGTGSVTTADDSVFAGTIAMTRAVTPVLLAGTELCELFWSPYLDTALPPDRP